jgi:glucokinase
VFRVGVDIGGTKIAIAVLDDRGAIRHRTRLTSALTLGRSDLVVDALTVAIRGCCAEAGVDVATIAGIGVGFPGVMDPTSRIIASCPNLPALDGLPLEQELAGAMGVPVFLETDVKLSTLGELRQGRAKGFSDLACVFVGSGIGCGLVFSGRLYRGADGASGELGHTIVEPRGLRCTCGRRGCLEMYCSGKALARKARTILPRPTTAHCDVESQGPWGGAELLIEAARAGCPDAVWALQHSFTYLGLALANLANLVNPRLILLGGGIVAGWPDGIEVVRATVHERARTIIRDRLTIACSSLGDDAGLIGASVLLDEELSLAT